MRHASKQRFFSLRDNSNQEETSKDDIKGMLMKIFCHWLITDLSHLAVKGLIIHGIYNNIFTVFYLKFGGKKTLNKLQNQSVCNNHTLNMTYVIQHGRHQCFPIPNPAHFQMSEFNNGHVQVLCINTVGLISVESVKITLLLRLLSKNLLNIHAEY